MPKLFLLFGLVASLSVPGAPLNVAFPAEKELMNPQRWKRNTSGSMSVTFDEREQALRVDVSFPKDVDRWVYPHFPISRRETLHGLEAMSFDLKVTTKESEFHGCREGNIILQGFNKYTPPKDAGTWQTIRISFKEPIGPKSQQFSLGINPRNNQVTYFVKNFNFEGIPMQPESPLAVTTTAPGTVFFSNSTPVLQFTRELTDLKYTLLDWHGNTLQSGDWPGRGAEDLVLPVLPNGYYLVKTQSSAATIRDFSFVVIPHPSTRVYPKDSFFGIDSAQSWLARPGTFECPWYDGDSFRLVSDLIAWAGFPHVRERLSWNEVNPQPDNLNWKHYLRNAQLLRERGITVSGMFHDSPPWSGKLKSLPGDLLAVYDFCRSLSHDFGDCMGDWEFWNEQDIGFAPDPVWDYMPAMKAACLGFKAGRPETIASAGALCTGISTSYHHVMYENEAAKYTDIMNYHTYSTPASYAAIAADMRDFLAKHGIPNRAVWLTECGTHLEGHSSTPGVMEKFMAHSPEQEMLHAEFYPKSQIYHMMQGLARNYFFVFPPYNEANGLKDWGTMRRDGSVKPAYAAMSTMISQLVSAKLLGEIKIRDSLKVFVFEQPDHSQTMVFWQVSFIDSQKNPEAPESFTLPLASGTYTQIDMLGTPHAITVANGQAELTATRYPSYIPGISGLKADVKAATPGVVQPYTPAADEDLTVLIRVDLDKNDFAVTGMKSIAEMPHDQGKLKLTVWNLEDKPKTGRLSVSGGILQGLPDEEISLPPRGKIELQTVFVPTVGKNRFSSTLVITGVFNGRKITRFHMPVNLIGLFLKACKVVKPDWLKPEAWKRNTSADRQTLVYDETEQALRWDVYWDRPVDHWFYPVHELNLPEESFAKVRAVEFEVKTSQNKVENNFNCAYLMLVYDQELEKGQARNLTYQSPMNDWEVRRIMFDEGINRSAIKLIRLGANPAGTQMTYWLRNIKLLTE